MPLYYNFNKRQIELQAHEYGRIKYSHLAVALSPEEPPSLAPAQQIPEPALLLACGRGGAGRYR